MLFGSNGNSYTVCTQSDMCMYEYTHCVHSMVTLVGQRNKRCWDSSECCLSRKFSTFHFGHLCQSFASAGIGSIVWPISFVICCRCSKARENGPLSGYGTVREATGNDKRYWSDKIRPPYFKITCDQLMPHPCALLIHRFIISITCKLRT